MITIHAFKGRTNTEDIAFKNGDGSDLDFNAEQVTAIKGIANGQEVECTFVGNVVSVNYGKLNIKPGIYQAQVVMFSPEHVEGKVIAGPGYPVEIELYYHA